MTKEYTIYGIIGLLMGIVLGFFLANWTWDGSAPGVASAGAAPRQESVNSSSVESELPPGHPPLDSAPTPAPPLPDSATARPSPPAMGAVELPSLDPVPAGSTEKRAEQEYQNIQLLRGLPADRITPIMEAFRSSLGVDCTYCHVADQYHKDDKPMKRVARDMITLTRNTNQQLGGASRVSCFTCHRGQPRPPTM